MALVVDDHLLLDLLTETQPAWLASELEHSAVYTTGSSYYRVALAMHRGTGARRLLSNPQVMVAFSTRIEKTGGVQGRSDPNRELLDAAALVGHLVPEGTVYRFLAEHRQRLFPDELFADLFPSGRGCPSVPADVIATVLVLQSLEGLSDRDAV